MEASDVPRLDWYAFYVADYRADTRHLSPMQHFAYREIIDEIFLSGQHEDPPSIPDDDSYLTGICRPQSAEEWATTRQVLIDGPRALLKSENGRLTQKRVSHEVEKALARADKAYKAAGARWGAGSDRDHAPAVKPSPLKEKSNGNGAEHMSRKQFLYFCSRVNRWRETARETLAGGTDADWNAAFLREFGMSWSLWEAELRHHNAS